MRAVLSKNRTKFERFQGYYALNDLDKKLKKYLNFKNGFFIEAGANDGLAQSNTYFFEKNKGWTGLLVEPIPELASQCKINRPNCLVENCALVPFNYQSDHITMTYCNLMSLVKGAMKSESDELDHLKLGAEVQQIETFEVRVPAQTLNAILDKHRIETIDLFSLDVEGYELDVLKGLDFEKYHPKFMLIEARFKSEIEAFLNPIYTPIAELSFHDVLYKSRKI